MLKYIFAAIFIALAWAAVLVFPEILPLWLAIVVSAAIAVGLLLFVVIQSTKSHKATAKLERALDQQGGEGMRPDQQAEIMAMQAEFQRAVAALKASKLGRSGRDALGLLPWYVIIGPPGSGKTTALRNSGLKFPSSGKGAVKGVGGTRNCDWWLSNEAILLDTAGRWATEDDDREEWLAFLDLLRATRPGKPINGILVAVSVAELQSSEEEIEALARRLRERVDEVMGRLDMVVPVYMLVTKVDLVPGFVETFGDLRDKERGQIWGFSLPLLAENHERQELFAERLDEVIRIIEGRALQRVGEERNLDARPRIYEFPQQFAELRKNLTDLCAHLFAENAYQDAPIMRGTYFTSGTQVGQPIDRLMSKMAEAFGVRPRLSGAGAAGGPPVKAKSYFVRDLFMRVVIPDRDVAMRSSRVLRKQQALRYLITTAALLAAVAGLFLPIKAYLANRQFVADTFAFVEALGRIKSGSGALHSNSTLEQVEGTAVRLAEGPHFQLNPLFAERKALEPLHGAVDRLMMRPLLDADVRFMGNFLRGQGGDASGLRDGLMLHLLLTQAKEGDEPTPGKSDWRKRWVPTILKLSGDRWDAITPRQLTTPARRAVESSMRFLITPIEDPLVLPDRDSVTVNKVRTALVGGGNNDPLADLIADRAMPPPVGLFEFVGGSSLPLYKTAEPDPARKGKPTQGPEVPGAFTPEGWGIVKKRLELLADDKDVNDEGWVLGELRKKKKVDVEALQTRYFQRYVEEWRQFLLTLKMQEPGSVQETRDLYRTLLRDKPFDVIWRNASKFLIIKDDSPLTFAKGKAADALLKKSPLAAKLKKEADEFKGRDRQASRREVEEAWGPDRVGHEFASFLKFGAADGGIKAYNQILLQLQAALGEEGTPEPKNFKTVLRDQRRSLGVIISDLNENNWEQGTLERLLMPPLSAAEVTIIGASGDSANRKWCESIQLAFQPLAEKYPFVTGRGVRDVRVGDLEKFFQPKAGTLWAYYEQVLQNDIEHPAGTTLFRLKEDASVKYTEALMKFLTRAQELTDFLFANSKDAGKVGVPYGIRIRSSGAFESVMFDGGLRRVTYRNTIERWEEMSWPSRVAQFHYREKVVAGRTPLEGDVGLTDREQGDTEWKLFHLLELARVDPKAGEDFFAATWETPLGDPIRADLRPPTMLNAFKGFKIPKAIVPGSKPCGQ